MHPLRIAAILLLSIPAAACSDSAESAPQPDSGAANDATNDDVQLQPDGGGEDGVVSIDGADGEGGVKATAPFKVASYPGDGGKFFLVTITVNGSPPIDVLLDTGSNGLRLFKEALKGTAVNVGSQVLDVEFGGGDKLAGHVATAELSFGDVKTDGAIAFHLVESFECAPAYPSCDFADGTGAMLTDVGIHGILGVSERPGIPAEVYSPFAQIAAPLRNGYVVRTGGFDATAGEITFGISEEDAAGFAMLAMPSNGSLPNGMPAWGDDQGKACFVVHGKAVDPPCTDVVFDTGSSAEIIYAPNLPAAEVKDGALAPGVTFEATAGTAFSMKLTVAAMPTAGIDLVLIDTVEPFAILGTGVFFRNDVLFDQSGGRIGFKPR